MTGKSWKWAASSVVAIGLLGCGGQVPSGSTPAQDAAQPNGQAADVSQPNDPADATAADAGQQYSVQAKKDRNGKKRSGGGGGGHRSGGGGGGGNSWQAHGRSGGTTINRPTHTHGRWNTNRPDRINVSGLPSNWRDRRHDHQGTYNRYNYYRSYGNYILPYYYNSGVYTPYGTDLGYPFLYNLSGQYFPYFYNYASGMATAYNTASVVIQGNTFMPNNLALPVGGTISWVNADQMPHTLMLQGSSPLITTGVLAPGQTSSPITLAQPGVYIFMDQFNPSLQMTVTVQ